jgi:hypothetical protein
MKVSAHSLDPVDRPGSPDAATPGLHAWDAADAVRRLNHVTLSVTGPRCGYESPSDVDTVIGGLHTLACRLPPAPGAVPGSGLAEDPSRLRRPPARPARPALFSEADRYAGLSDAVRTPHGSPNHPRRVLQRLPT